tara:strand:+ start:6695 stop:6826 length:132 start_codon:yes stop_codon:yes gene_type:complete
VKNRIKKYIIVLLLALLSSLGFQMATPDKEDEKKMDDEEHMFI